MFDGSCHMSVSTDHKNVFSSPMQVVVFAKDHIFKAAAQKTETGRSNKKICTSFFNVPETGVSPMATDNEQTHVSDNTMPRGDLCTRTLAMPADTNPSGDIFGGWLMSQMDIAGGVLASQIAEGRIATVAVDGMTFLRPVYVGDTVCVYGDIERIGNTSIVLHLEAWVLRRNQPPRIKVTEATFTFVAIDAEGRPRPVRSDEAKV